MVLSSLSLGFLISWLLRNLVLSAGCVSTCIWWASEFTAAVLNEGEPRRCQSWTKATATIYSAYLHCSEWLVLSRNCFELRDTERGCKLMGSSSCLSACDSKTVEKSRGAKIVWVSATFGATRAYQREGKGNNTAAEYELERNNC